MFDQWMLSGDRPAPASASRTRPNCRSVSTAEANGMLNSSANRATSAGVRRGPRPPTMIGGRGVCTGLGSAGESLRW